MNNILYIGPYREFSGDGNISRNYIKALIATGYNISIRPIYNIFKSYPEFEIDNDILELENNFSKKYHTVIQHSYPHEFCYDSRFDQNIGIPILESYNYKNRLIDFLKIPDKLIVPSQYVKNCCFENNNYSDKIRVIFPPIDIEKINNYISTNIIKNNNRFTFYVIDDFVAKNNIKNILEAFWLSVDEDDSVDLVLKTKNKVQDHANLHQIIEYELSQLNNIFSHRKPDNKKPKIIIGETKKEAINYLHNHSSCYIDVSSGKQFGFSSLEALCFNKKVITVKGTAQSEIIDNTNNYIIDSISSHCKDDCKIYDIYNTFDQKWICPEPSSLVLAMKTALQEDKNQENTRIEKSQEKVKQYTIEKTAQALKEYDI